MNACWSWLRSARVLAVLLWFGLITGESRAQTVAPPRIVRVEVDSVVSDEDALRASLRELLARVDVRVVEIDVPDEQLLALVVITGSVRGATVRVFPKHARESSTTHRVPSAESEALFRETLAHVVLGAVEPLLSAPEPAPQPPPAPPAAPELPARPPLSKQYDLGFGAGALRIGADAWAAQLSLLAQLRLGTRIPSLFGATFGGTVPREQDEARVHSALWLLSVRARAGVEPLVRGRVRLAVLTGMGLDAITASARTERAVERLESPRREVDPIVFLASELRVALARGVSGLVALGCDWDLTPHDFTVIDGGHEHTLWRAAALRPNLNLGVTWSTP